LHELLVDGDGLIELPCRHELLGAIGLRGGVVGLPSEEGES
jgi:hypothetical protein